MTTNRHDHVRLEHAGRVARVTLDRPEKLNALTARMAADLHSVLDGVAADNSIRVVIVTGAGRGFCSGADVNELLAPDSEITAVQPGFGITDLSTRIRGIPQPVIAAVNGVAAGAGLAIALACDIRIASQEAGFSSIFVKRSLVPDAGASLMLPRLVGVAAATEMALTGNVYDSQWALEKGLVSRVVPADTLMQEASALAEQIADNPPLAVRATRSLLYDGDNDALAGAMRRESDANALLSATHDAREAVLAFLEKRSPVYRGE
ncbi:MAG: enoyl-CoA hydratase-related protein [Chloroflexota bacterium]|nr:enoyl-CoA hydratase-related protein [Chloroflexota bacterium]MDE2942356.1 enoyl-CoA hydratase-related protein [Chloroflexota bacterium]MDE3268239.1 enoyl-CoA hydratase-related protein [Chloroflexota bacterium]